MASQAARAMKEKGRIMKAHPNISNKVALKQAWAKVKGGKVSGVKKKKATRKKKVVGSTRRKTTTRRRPASPRRRVSGLKASGEVGIGAIKNTARQAETALKLKLGKQYAAHYSATTKTAKRKIAKQMAETKRKISSVKRIINKK